MGAKQVYVAPVWSNYGKRGVRQ